MGHDHSHHHGSKNIKVAFFLNLSFTIIEIVGGLLTNSLAILSDALHDLGDSLSIGLSWYFQNVSEKGRDKKYSYRYKRFSLLGAIINAIVLLIGSAFILTKAIPGLFDPNATDPKGMLILAVFGVIVNGAAVVKLRKGTSINEAVISMHLLEDVLSVHLKLNKDYTLHEMSEIKIKVKKLLITDIQHVTIEFEGVGEQCETC